MSITMIKVGMDHREALVASADLEILLMTFSNL